MERDLTALSQAWVGGVNGSFTNQQYGVTVEVVRHPANANVGRWCTPNQGNLFTRQPDAKGFTVLPKRWVVERTHAWIEKARRLVMHHDRRVEVSEAWVWLAVGRQLLNRLAHTT